MTKPKEKTRDELTAEIEQNEEKIKQYQNREKIIKQQLSRGGTPGAQSPPLFAWRIL